MAFEYQDFSVDPSEYELEHDGQEPGSPEPAPVGSFERGFVGDSNLETIDNAETVVRESLGTEDLKWPADKIEDIALAVREAVANAVIHGNLEVHHKKGETLEDYDERWRAAAQGENGAKKVNMEIYASERAVRVVVTDEGNFVAEPEPVPDAESDERVMMPSGRGIMTIVGNCDAVESAPGQLTMTWYRDGKEIPGELAEKESAAV